jgi:hypothetical protein
VQLCKGHLLLLLLLEGLLLCMICTSCFFAQWLLAMLDGQDALLLRG